MSKLFKNFIAVIVGLPILLAVLVGVNFYVISRLLRVDSDVLSGVKAQLVPVGKPLVLKVDEDGNLREAAHEIAALLGVKGQDLPSSHPLLVDISWVQRANPYPPLLAEISEGYRRQLGYCSFGYLGVDDRYHQVTLYVGESDTLPAFLVEKVRGRSTLWGDYFTQYLFYLSRETELLDPNGRPHFPQIDAIEWASFRGGSYDGFEEIFGNAAATLAELLLIGMVGAIVLVRRRRRRVSLERS